MPWVAKDAKTHSKGLSPKQAVIWSRVANDILARCEAKKLDGCEGKAIRQANAVAKGVKASAADFCDIPEIAESPELTFLDAEEFKRTTPLWSDETHVLRHGLLFRSGKYEDKDFEMTDEELANAVEVFDGPVPIDLEHMPTVLDGKLGEVISIEAFGDELHGVVRLPRWLDDAIGSAERKVSATWDRATKTLLALALCLSPRVEDSALMAAFTEAAKHAAKRHDTPHGRFALQEIHDTASRSGAVCKAPAAAHTEAEMASRHENAAIQSVHDLAASHGARCHSLDATAPRPYSPYSQAGESGLETVTGSEAGSHPAPAAPEKEKRMSFKDTLKSWFAAGMPDEFEPVGALAEAASGAAGVVVPPVVTATQTDPRDEQLRLAREREAQLTAENRKLVQERIGAEAVSFYDRQLADHRAFPSEREAIIADYIQRATDDALHGSVEFNGTQVSRIQQLTASFAARPQNQFNVEQLAPEVAALFNLMKTPKAGEGEVTPERKAELLAMTPMGSALLKERNGSAK